MSSLAETLLSRLTPEDSQAIFEAFPYFHPGYMLPSDDPARLLKHFISMSHFGAGFVMGLQFGRGEMDGLEAHRKAIRDMRDRLSRRSRIGATTPVSGQSRPQSRAANTAAILASLSLPASP